MKITPDAALASKAWPFQEAQKVVDRLAKADAKAETGSGGERPVLFETGYGPSGLPHIGTFGEVVRTTMVRQAFHRLSDRPTRLIAFSDDMDGLRKVPDNVPQQAMLAEHLGKPLTQVPDPFGSHESFGHHNNARLQAFLDSFGFDYEFVSSSECYKSGAFDAALRAVLQHYDAIVKVILPTLGPERRKTYSPFLPLCPDTGVVLQVPVVARDEAAGTIVYEQAGKRVEVPVTGGQCKLQWKADWAMRWHALAVDYEMSGKDLIDSVRLSGKICRILGSPPPEGFHYELFLDDKGEKISKSIGNGISVEEWLRYAPPESLALYMYQQPRRAKRLYFDVIPRAVDDYLNGLTQMPKIDDPVKAAQSPLWHIHDGAPPSEQPPISFSLLMNLAGAANAEDKATLWGFIQRYVPDAGPESYPLLDRLVGFALAYYNDHVKPGKVYRPPTAKESDAIADLADALAGQPSTADAESLQNLVFEIGKRHQFDNLRDWFRALYEVLFGQSQGPRMGSFIALYGIAESEKLMRERLAQHTG